MPPRVLLDVELTTILKILLVIAGAVFLYVLKDVIFAVFVAIIVASAVAPLAGRLVAKRFPRLLAVICIYLFFISLLVIFLSIVVPVMAAELNQLLHNLPQIANGASGALETGKETLISQIQKIIDNIGQLSLLNTDSYLGVLIGLFGGAVSFISIVIMSFYLSIMPEGVTSFFRSFLPAHYEEYVVSLWKRAEKRVARWIQGQLLLAASMGLIVFVGLSIMGVKYALLLGITALIFEVVPFAGPVIAAAPALVFAFGQSVSLGVSVAIFYVVVQQLESHVLVPVIIGKSLGLNPVTVVVALLIGARIAGILGVLLAVPTAVVIVEIIEDLAKQRAAHPGEIGVPLPE